MPAPYPDKLRFDFINSLPHPLIAQFYGGDEWQIHDIEVQTGLMRILVCGMLQVEDFSSVKGIRDGDGQLHDADLFYTDAP